MKDKKNKNITPVSIITVICCAFLTIGVMTLFPACGPKEDGTWMSCHYAQLTVFALGLVATVLSVIAIAIRRFTLRALLYIVTAVLSAIAAIVPGNVIHLCMMNEMQCRAVMRPAVILISVITIVFCIISILTGRGKKGR